MDRRVVKVKILTLETGRRLSTTLPSPGFTPSVPRASGFTLLELMVVIAIAALVVGVSAPSMQRLYNSSQYHGAVNDVVTRLASARYGAIRGGIALDVLINPETREVSLGEKTTELPDSIELEILGSRELNREGAGVIRFYPDGGSSGGYVNLTHENGMAVQVAVDWLLGTVSLCKEDCTSDLPI
ncbi:MAG: general secretion pathway protein H [Halioglobus sp.]|jgi:general secretion pathway protein H